MALKGMLVAGSCFALFQDHGQALMGHFEELVSLFRHYTPLFITMGFMPNHNLDWNVNSLIAFHEFMYRQWETCYPLSRNGLLIVQAMERAAEFADISLDLSIRDGSFQEQLKYLEATKLLEEKLQVCQANEDANEMDGADDITLTDCVEYSIDMEICTGEGDDCEASFESSTNSFGFSTSTATTFGSSAATNTSFGSSNSSAGTSASSATAWSTATGFNNGASSVPPNSSTTSPPPAVPGMNSSNGSNTPSMNNTADAANAASTNNNAKWKSTADTNTASETRNPSQATEDEVLTGTVAFDEANITDTLSLLLFFKNPHLQKIIKSQCKYVKTLLRRREEVKLGHILCIARTFQYILKHVCAPGYNWDMIASNNSVIAWFDAVSDLVAFINHKSLADNAQNADVLDLADDIRRAMKVLCVMEVEVRNPTPGGVLDPNALWNMTELCYFFLNNPVYDAVLAAEAAALCNVINNGGPVLP
jgi:hypothetical protein